MWTISIATTGLYLLVAADTGEPALSPAYLLQFGVLGAVVICIIWRRWLVPGWALDEAEKECARLRAELAALRGAYEEKAERTMTALTAAVEELTRAQGRER